MMTTNTEWPLWEVFVRSRAGLDHKHCGSLHAADPQMAIQMARDVYTRRMEGTSIWVVRSDQIVASASVFTPDSGPVLAGNQFAISSAWPFIVRAAVRISSSGGESVLSWSFTFLNDAPRFFRFDWRASICCLTVRPFGSGSSA